MNVITLIGRLTRDPEVKFGASGKAYCRVSLAVNRPFDKEQADFINCVSFGKTAELIGEYFRKGHQIGVSGHLQMNQFEANGEKRTSYDVIVDSFDFLNNKKEEGTVKQESKNTSKNNEVSEDEEEFPF
ncbi:single-stranded DNA-binding protein [Fusobacterium necrophorum subsp. funduliforme]|uniref:single-stranded DNA-binding protein n=1 Tax=Fusobacterium necrophorum TaxID=859 RepID=UPI000787B686|nr:single-stranded DNA-binding protein [Fusobacterium necrophorum]KYM58540.1 single-stranded DNA-binding protein [Fusobacterium necrophorum subsp. funduliforme]